MPRFSVIIVNYNGGSYVQAALTSLAKQTYRDFEVFLVDNASEDGSIDHLNTDDLPDFVLMKQSENLGFAEGNNIAARIANGDWLVLLNPDAEAEPDWLDRIDQGISRYPETSMFAVAQYDLHREGKLDGVGDCYLGFGFPWRGGYGYSADATPIEGECFSPCGAGAIYKRTVFLQHNGFDERFFCYCEDVDLGYRLRLAGERCIFLPEAQIRHAGSALSNKTSGFADYHGSRNRVWCYVKNTPPLLFWLTLPFHLLMSITILMKYSFQGRFLSTAKGMLDSLLGLPKLISERSFGPPKRTVSLKTITRAMSWNPLSFFYRRPCVRSVNQPFASSSSSEESR